MRYERLAYAKDIKATKDEIFDVAKPIFDIYAEYKVNGPSIDDKEENKKYCVECGTKLQHSIDVSWDEEHTYPPFVWLKKQCPKCRPINKEKNVPKKEYIKETYYGIDMNKIKDFEIKLCKISERLDSLNHFDISKELMSSFEELLTFNVPIMRTGPDFKLTTDTGTVIGQGSFLKQLNDEYMIDMDGAVEALQIKENENIKHDI